MELPHFDGWHLLGAFPEGGPDDVGSWLLHSGGEAMLLEVPPGVTVRVVATALGRLGLSLKYATASHDHEDHFDAECWHALGAAYPEAEFVHPDLVSGDRLLHLGAEPVWLVKGPKHSLTDVVTAFRGLAMTGDIELGTLDSVNREVPKRVKRKSMAWLAAFPERTGFGVHSVVSAHLNDVRAGVDWPALFAH